MACLSILICIISSHYWKVYTLVKHFQQNHHGHPTEEKEEKNQRNWFYTQNFQLFIPQEIFYWFHFQPNFQIGTEYFPAILFCKTTCHLSLYQNQDLSLHCFRENAFFFFFKHPSNQNWIPMAHYYQSSFLIRLTKAN